MRRGDLMKPDLLSEIVLLSSGALIFIAWLFIILWPRLRSKYANRCKVTGKRDKFPTGFSAWDRCRWSAKIKKCV